MCSKIIQCYQYSSLLDPNSPAAPKFLPPPDSSSDIDTGCAFGKCIRFLNLLSSVERDFVFADRSSDDELRTFSLDEFLRLVVLRVVVSLKLSK